jgi:hypothetical protein
MEFLGHSIGPSGIRPLPSRVQAIAEFPRPVTVRQLQAFLGLLNFYRRFLPAAARLILPLTRALCGNPGSNHVLQWSNFRSSKVLPLVYSGTGPHSGRGGSIIGY